MLELRHSKAGHSKENYKKSVRKKVFFSFLGLLVASADSRKSLKLLPCFKKPRNVPCIWHWIKKMSSKLLKDVLCASVADFWLNYLPRVDRNETLFFLTSIFLFQMDKELCHKLVVESERKQVAKKISPFLCIKQFAN